MHNRCTVFALRVHSGCIKNVLQMHSGCIKGCTEVALRMHTADAQWLHERMHSVCIKGAQWLH